MNQFLEKFEWVDTDMDTAVSADRMPFTVEFSPTIPEAPKSVIDMRFAPNLPILEMKADIAALLPTSVPPAKLVLEVDGQEIQSENIEDELLLVPNAHVVVRFAEDRNEAVVNPHVSADEDDLGLDADVEPQDTSTHWGNQEDLDTLKMIFENLEEGVCQIALDQALGSMDDAVTRLSDDFYLIPIL
jgi:hypothetical protein